ncbi:MAG: formylglycine-generating enzyme family protein [Spirochaetaceae bacterium]|nr:formylglycine-generating enzyme family protein [Spirochaetaceae bacterium]
MSVSSCADEIFFAFVKGGTFLMGNVQEKSSAIIHEYPQHKVTLKGFYLGRFQVIQNDYERLMLKNPSHFKGPNLPVEQVSWYDAIEYCNRRSAAEKLHPAYTLSQLKKDRDNLSAFDELKWLVTLNPDSDGYRLPTEAEWEYAARGGAVSSRRYMYAGSDDADTVSWYGANSKGATHPVGTKGPNELGLYDMSGNVWEWCWDWLGAYPAEDQDNPLGPVSGSDRVYRGGGWAFSPRHLRCVDRYGAHPAQYGNYLGFRLARSAGADKESDG